VSCGVCCRVSCSVCCRVLASDYEKCMCCTAVYDCLRLNVSWKNAADAIEKTERECVLQCVAVCCSVLQCVAVCCCVLLCVAVRCCLLQCVAVCCRVLQCVAVCCGRMQPMPDRET